jgi:hypothetical protein
MYKKNLFGVVFAVVFAAIPIFVFTACDQPTADAFLDGKWVAVSGAQLEFANGKYTKTLVTGRVETGTYNAVEGYITFNRIGVTPQTLPYKLDGTRLTLDITVYYRDTPGTPDFIDGKWTPYTQYGPAIIFENGKPRKGNPGIIEGDFIDVMATKGKYTITNRNLPGSNVLNLTPTHLHGSNISTFVEGQLRISLVELFDLELLQTPGYDIEDWWFTIDETRRLFETAAGRAPNLEDQARIISAMQYFFSLSDETYDYSIENDSELNLDYPTAAFGMNKLTLRGNSSWGIIIRTYFKLTDDFGQIGLPQDPDHDPDDPDDPGPFPINPIDPNDPKGGFKPPKDDDWWTFPPPNKE